MPRRFVKNIYTKFHENPTNGLVFDAKPQRHRQTDKNGCPQKAPISPRTGRLNQQVRYTNGAWQVAAVVLLSSFVVENFFTCKYMGSYCKIAFVVGISNSS
jgi:hypothetical protein